MHRTACLPVFALVAACGGPDRIALDPPSVQFHGRGQAIPIHASAFARNGRPLPQEICRWSSTDEKVATVAGPHNQATVTAVGPGTAAARCAIGRLVAEAQVVVRLAQKVEVAPDRVALRVLDRPEPAALDVRVTDTEGRLLSGRPVVTRCLDESVCRGDGRGQLWAVGPGESRVLVEVDGAQAEIAAQVVDARTAEGKPRQVRGNPMLDYEKAVKALGK